MTPGLLAPRPGQNCPGGGPRRITSNRLGNHSPQAYEVENKELAPALGRKMSKDRYHVSYVKSVNVEKI